ncbi:cupin domain-containing protein [Streptomyces griseoincarnatus]
MSLHHLLAEADAARLLATWPQEPEVLERGTTALDQVVTAESLWEHVRLGCVPADEVRVVRGDVPSITAAAFSTNGRTEGPRLVGLYENGYTIRLGNLQRVMVPLARISRGIQEETGYSNYVHAFLTPPGCQGLRHHWDQQMAVIVQLAGVKRWQLWGPVVESPMREVGESWRVWRPEFIPEWEAKGPDLEVDLRPGQALTVPRGWVHNPFVPDGVEEGSVHLTFAIRERTPYWLAEQLVAGALTGDAAFRRIIPPPSLEGVELPARLAEARGRLVEYLEGLDVAALADQVAAASRTHVEYTT